MNERELRLLRGAREKLAEIDGRVADALAELSSVGDALEELDALLEGESPEDPPPIVNDGRPGPWIVRPGSYGTFGADRLVEGPRKVPAWQEELGSPTKEIERLSLSVDMLKVADMGDERNQLLLVTGTMGAKTSAQHVLCSLIWTRGHLRAFHGWNIGPGSDHLDRREAKERGESKRFAWRTGETATFTILYDVGGQSATVTAQTGGGETFLDLSRCKMPDRLKLPGNRWAIAAGLNRDEPGGGSPPVDLSNLRVEVTFTDGDRWVLR